MQPFFRRGPHGWELGLSYSSEGYAPKERLDCVNQPWQAMVRQIAEEVLMANGTIRRDRWANRHWVPNVLNEQSDR